VPVGDSRCSCQWDQGAGRVGRRVPRFIESWADLLRSCRRRGMRAQVLAVGDGALGFWKAIREVFPETWGQRCWLRAGCNVLAALPKSAHPGAKAALAEIWAPRTATTPSRPPRRSRTSTHRSGPRPPRRSPTTSTSCSRSTTTRLSTGSTCAPPTRSNRPFATVRLRQRVTKGPGSRAAGIAMAFKLIESAQARWRAVNAPHLVALVRAGATFEKGILLERPDDSGGDQQVA